MSARGVAPFRCRAVACAALFIASTGAWSTVNAANAGGVTVRNAWMPPASAGQPAAPVYLDIVSERSRRLVEISSPAAASVAIVDRAATDDRTTRTTIVLDARVPLRFTPGSRHLELRDVGNAIKAGDKVPLSLTFDGANDTKTSMIVNVRVREARRSGR